VPRMWRSRGRALLVWLGIADNGRGVVDIIKRIGGGEDCIAHGIPWDTGVFSLLLKLNSQVLAIYITMLEQL
jgi:hypothetical protein